MNYNEYLDLLDRNNIKLFDHDKRISYHNIKTYNLMINQKGGGNFKSYQNFKNIVDISLSSNPQLLLSLLN
tara:strand:- start:1808 stop:2020 length:213 start_codon:yes stop_codon:yes gene_type:complete